MHDSNGGFYGTMAGTVDPGTMDQPDCRRNSCDPGDTNVVEYKRPGGLGFDKNASRILEWKESAAMGIAISADAGMAVLGLIGQGKMIYFFPVLAAASSLLFLTLGGRIGGKIKKIYPAGGLFLVILGLMRICQ